MHSSDPHQPSQPGTKIEYDSKQPPNPRRLAFTVLWVAFFLIAGSGVTGYCVLEFGELGLSVLWPIGWVGGFVASKILDGKSKPVGALLVASVFLIVVFSEAQWLHERIEGADESWFKALSLLPTFVREYQFSAFLALAFFALGAVSTWQAVAVRYLRVRID